MSEASTEYIPLEPEIRNRVLRFIHTGLEVPQYFPGSWDYCRYFKTTNLKAVEEVVNKLDCEKRGIDLVQVIVKAYKDGWYTRFDTIAFALAKCLVTVNSKVKEAVYKAAKEICTSSEEMMLFNKFTWMLSTGNGKGWNKTMKLWYLNKDPLVLAKELTRARSRHGRDHRTLIRKCHLKIDPADCARDAVIKYVLFGMKKTKQLVNNNEANVVMEYIQSADDLRHCEDPKAAAVLIENNKFSIENLPGHLLTSQVVWNAILPQFSLDKLLDNILRIQNMGFLTSDSETTAIVLSMLGNTELIKKSRLTPLAVYIVICNYKNKFKPLKAPKKKILKEKEERRRERKVFISETGTWTDTSVNTRKHPKELKNLGIDLPPNPEITNALLKLMDQTWTLSERTGRRYFITMDMRHHMFKGRHFSKGTSFLATTKKGKKTMRAIKALANVNTTENTEDNKGKKRLYAECFRFASVMPGFAALCVALQLLKREDDVTIAVFTDTGVQCVSIEKGFTTLEEAQYQLRQIPNLGTVQMNAPMKYATTNKQKVDVFINMIDRPSRYMELEYAKRFGRGEGGRFGPPPTIPPKGGLATVATLAEKPIEDHCPVRALLKYRKEMEQPDARLITMSLASHRCQTTDGTHDGVFDIIGIDENVPRLIDAFSVGQFN